MDKRQLSIIILISFVVGGLSGAIAAPLVFQSLPRPEITFANSASRAAEKNGGTLRQTNFVDEESAALHVVERVNPAVVNIGIFVPFFGQDIPFELRRPDERSAPEKKKSGDKPELQQVGGGSGFIISVDGLIVTNRHVVADKNAIYKVTMADGQEYEAKVLAADPVLDVAMIKIDGKNLPTLSLGDSDKLKLGQSVIAIGNALAEFGNTVTRGVVSGIGRRVEAGGGGFSEVLDEAIQTDAAINPGNSGGPLLNLAGEVVGINTAVSSQGQSVGFAIPINAVKRTIESVRKVGRIVRPWLGVRYTPVTPRLVELNKLPVKDGALVVRGQDADELAVIPGSPADKAGLAENDIILEVNGKKLEDKDSLAKELGKFDVGREVKLKVWHQGQEKIVSVTLAEFPADKK